MADNNAQDNAASQGECFEGGANDATWAADANNFAVPAMPLGELPKTLERRIINDKPVKDRYDARKWQQHVLSGDNKYDRFNELYEFRYEYRPVEEENSNHFYATYHLRGADGGEGAAVTEGADGMNAGPTPADMAAGETLHNARSTAAYTGARHRDASGGEAASQGLWRSYYAQQRERDVAVNNVSYRREHFRDVPMGHHGPMEGEVVLDHIPVEHHNTFDYRAGHARQLSLNHYERRASPVRSQSPVRMMPPHEEA